MLKVFCINFFPSRACKLCVYLRCLLFSMAHQCLYAFHWCALIQQVSGVTMTKNMRIHVRFHVRVPCYSLNYVANLCNTHSMGCTFSYKQGGVVVNAISQIFFKPDVALNIKVDFPLLVAFPSYYYRFVFLINIVSIESVNFSNPTASSISKFDQCVF